MYKGLEKYKSLVKKISRENSHVNPIVDVSDFENELWIKLMQVLPDLKEVSNEDAFKIIKVILKNKCTDINRHYACRPDTSEHAVKSTMGNDEDSSSSIDDFVCDETSRYYAQLNARFETNYKLIFGKELFNIIKNWVTDKDEDTKNFILNAISPSDEIMIKWEERVVTYKNNMCKNSRVIPPYSLINLLGITQCKYYKILKSLTKFLKQNGYNPEVILGRSV